MNQIPPFVKALTSDVLAVFMGKPPTSTLSHSVGAAYESWLNKKAKESHDIFFNELAKGKRLAGDVDPDAFFGLLHRYLNATKQGAARSNLRLMAQVLAGSLEQDCPFKPDKLASFADVVANLTRDEIKFLAVFWSSHLVANGLSFEAVDPNIKIEEQVQIRTQAIALERLVPSICASKLDFSSLGGAVTRTGLIVAQSVYGGTRFDISPRLLELVQLTDLNSALDP